MILPEFFLYSLLALVVASASALFRAIHRAREGYEDEFGFHLGSTPAFLFLHPAPVAFSSPFVPDAPTRAEPPLEAKPEGRTILGSKPPMLPADLQAEDLKKQTGQSSEASAGS